MLFYSATEDWKNKDDVIFRKIDRIRDPYVRWNKLLLQRPAWQVILSVWAEVMEAKKRFSEMWRARGERKFMREDDRVVKAIKRLEKHMQSCHRETLFSALNICANSGKGIRGKCFPRTWMFAFASFLAQREESICVPTCHVTWL